MKATKSNVLSFVKNQLATNRAWALKGLVRIFERQTADEQSSESTSHDNGIGFTGADANFLTSLAKQYMQRGSLSDKQMAFVFKKMPKYAGQIVSISDVAKLNKMVEATPVRVYPSFNAYLRDNFRSECE
jgi:hypothetical protein